VSPQGSGPNEDDWCPAIFFFLIQKQHFILTVWKAVIVREIASQGGVGNARHRLGWLARWLNDVAKLSQRPSKTFWEKQHSSKKDRNRKHG